jgi:hypothetical protein
MWTHGLWSPLRFSSSPCFLLSGVCRRGRGEKSSLEACRYVEDSELFRHLDETRAVTAPDHEHSRLATRRADRRSRRFVTSSRTGFRSSGRAMTQAKLYSAIDKVIRGAPLRPGQARLPVASVLCAR